jgi:dihydrofolate reductase
MRKLIISTFVTLDGVMQAPGGPDEDRDNRFPHGGWSVTYWDEAMFGTMSELMEERPFDVLLGRKTYEIFAAHWPDAGDEFGAGPLNRATKYVVSTTLDRLEWGPSVLIDNDVVERIRQITSEDGPEIQVHGSSQLIQTLLANELADELHLMIFPLVLGEGKRLFEDGAVPAGLRLVASKTSSTGVIIAKYQRASGIQYGSFALDQVPVTA